MTEIPEAHLQDKIAAAFRLVGEDNDFRKYASQDDVTLAFSVKESGVRGLVHIENGRIHWSSHPVNNANLLIEWRRREDLQKWISGISPLWWHRLLGRLAMEGKATPVTQECLYLFRNYFKMMIEPR